MKTAEEILENIMCCTIEEDADLDVKSNYYYQHDDVGKAIEQAQKEAYQEGQSSPKIKKLEWTDHLRHCFVDTPFGVYLILRNHKFEENESWTLYFNSYVIDGYIDSDKAQEVAQADYERRVKDCLI